MSLSGSQRNGARACDCDFEKAGQRELNWDYNEPNILTEKRFSCVCTGISLRQNIKYALLFFAYPQLNFVIAYRSNHERYDDSR